MTYKEILDFLKNKRDEFFAIDDKEKAILINSLILEISLITAKKEGHAIPDAEDTLKEMKMLLTKKNSAKKITFLDLFKFNKEEK